MTPAIDFYHIQDPLSPDLFNYHGLELIISKWTSTIWEKKLSFTKCYACYNIVGLVNLNTLYGHDKCDELILQVAKELKICHHQERIYRAGSNFICEIDEQDDVVPIENYVKSNIPFSTTRQKVRIIFSTEEIYDENPLTFSVISTAPKFITSALFKANENRQISEEFNSDFIEYVIRIYADGKEAKMVVSAHEAT